MDKRAAVTFSNYDQLQRQIAIYESSRWHKLIHYPLRPMLSRVLTAYATARGIMLPVKVRTFWGDSMTVVLPEVVSASIFAYRVYEPGLTMFTLKYCKPGMIFFDVGAHFGYFTLLAAHLVGDSGVVHAFEPTPSTHGVLAANAAGKPNIVLCNQAAWSQSDTIVVNDFGVRFSAFNSTYEPRLTPDEKKKIKVSSHTVQAVSLDTYARERKVKPDFIKIDAESAEKEILQGLYETLTSAKPIVSLEVGDQGIRGAGTSRELVKFMSDFHYDAMEYKGGRIVPHRLQQQYEYANILFVPR